jgi:hypothetical protein
MSKYDVNIYTDQDLYEIVGYDPNNNNQDLEEILIEKLKSYMYSQLKEDRVMFTFLENIYSRFYDTNQTENIYTLSELENANFDKDKAHENQVAINHIKAKTPLDTNGYEVNVYDVSKYEDPELYNLINVSPSATDSEKEAKLIQLLQLYKNVKTDQGIKMFTFYSDIYTHFFHHTPATPADSADPDTLLFQNQTNINKQAPATDTTDDNIKYSKTLDYTPGKINPILKETYKRIISIDSQYRDAEYPSATDFTLNITETLKDVVSLKLYAVQIPVTWYTISNSYGSNYFFLKPIIADTTLGIYNNPAHEYIVEISPGNYSQSSLTSEIHTQLQRLGTIYTDVSFGTTSFSYVTTTAKSELTIDIQKVYNESYYDMIIGANIKSILKLENDIIINTFYSQHFNRYVDSRQNPYIVNANNQQLIIEQYNPLNPTIAINQIKIYLDLSTGTGTDISNIVMDLNRKLQNCPRLSKSRITTTVIGTSLLLNKYEWEIHLNRYTESSVVNSKLRLVFPSTTNDPNNVGINARILWQDGFHFQTSDSFTITEYKSYSDVSMSQTIPISNESITFRPKIDLSGGVYYDQSGYNDIVLNITNGSYTAPSLIAHINELIANTPLLYGTTFTMIQPTSTTNVVKLSVNINFIYTTKDYRIIFYDIYSFAKCTKVSNSYRNATADTTLGYILGFKDLVEYNLVRSNLGQTGTFLNPDTSPTYNHYTYQDSIMNLNIINTIITLEGDSVLSIYLYNYFMIILEDFNQNHLNDGLVTVSKRDTSVSLPSYANRKNYRACDMKTTGTSSIFSTTSSTISTSSSFPTAGLTANQVYSVEQIIATQNKSRELFNAGPFVKDMFALLPIKASGVEPGSIYVEFGGTLQQQERVYFGPVNVNRLAVKLINDKGDVVDLNGANWSFQLVCEQLYQKGGTLV